MHNQFFLFLIILSVASSIVALIIGIIYSKKTLPPTESVKSLNIANGTNGYLSGQTVFSKEYALLQEDTLVLIRDNIPDHTLRIAYSDIVRIKLRGWLFLRFEISSAKTTMNIAPISRLVVNDYKLAIATDTTHDYRLQYVALFHHFVQALQTKAVKQEVFAQIHWRLAQVRRGIAAFLIAIFILATVSYVVIVSTGSTVTLPF